MQHDFKEVDCILFVSTLKQDIHNLLMDTPHDVIPIAKDLRSQTMAHLRTMADNNLFCYDLKPANMVFRHDPLEVKFIDFGRDFCEWRPYSTTNEYLERAPVLSYIQTLADEHAEDNLTPQMLYSDLSFAVMVIILSANIAFTLDQSRHAIRASFSERNILNFMAGGAAELRLMTRGKHTTLIKEILRHRDIKGTIEHYMGRRNCGTKRVFYYAGFRKTIHDMFEDKDNDENDENDENYDDIEKGDMDQQTREKAFEKDYDSDSNKNQSEPTETFEIEEEAVDIDDNKYSPMKKRRSRAVKKSCKIILKKMSMM